MVSKIPKRLLSWSLKNKIYHILPSKAYRNMILVSKGMFSWARNPFILASRVDSLNNFKMVIKIQNRKSSHILLSRADRKIPFGVYMYVFRVREFNYEDYKLIGGLRVVAISTNHVHTVSHLY